LENEIVENLTSGLAVEAVWQLKRRNDSGIGWGALQ
jgi:hypothetical protein